MWKKGSRVISCRLHKREEDIEGHQKKTRIIYYKQNLKKNTQQKTNIK